MALKTVNTASKSASGSGKKFTGLAIMDVIGVNPSKEEMEKMGMKPEKEPEYFTVKEENGKKIGRLRLTFILKKTIGEGSDKIDLITNHSIFLESQVNITKKGSYQIIDKFGSSTYIDSSEWASKSFKNEYIDKDSAKQAFVGESDLIDLFKTLANLGKKDEITILDLCPDGQLKNLFTKSGHLEVRNSLRQIYAAYDENTRVSENMSGPRAKFLLGVRFDGEKTYQDVFPYNIGRVYSDAKYFHTQLKRIKDSNSEFFKTRFYGNIDLSKEFPKEEDYRLQLFGKDDAKPASSSASSKGQEVEDAFAIGEEDNGFTF